MIDFLVLGAGGAVPTPTHSPAAYWVRIGQHAVLLDPGPGALVRLLGSRHGPDSIDGIDTVLLTHLHLDHCADLAPLLFALHSPIPKAKHPLQLLGPVGLADYLERLRGIYGSWLDPTSREILLEEIEPGQRLTPAGSEPVLWQADGPAGGPAIEVFAARHPQSRLCETCLCFRFDDGVDHVAAFSGDTEPCPGLLEASRRADLLVVECSTPDDLATPGHMTPDRVGELCAEAQPGRVVLTHLYPPATKLDLPALVGRKYDGSVVAATDGVLFTIPATDHPGGTVP